MDIKTPEPVSTLFIYFQLFGLVGETRQFPTRSSFSIKHIRVCVCVGVCRYTQGHDILTGSRAKARRN